jgi:hypothetical protein
VEPVLAIRLSRVETVLVPNLLERVSFVLHTVQRCRRSGNPRNMKNPQFLLLDISHHPDHSSPPTSMTEIKTPSGRVDGAILPLT